MKKNCNTLYVFVIFIFTLLYHSYGLNISKHLFEQYIDSDIVEKDVLLRMLLKMCIHVEVNIQRTENVLDSITKLYRTLR